MRKKCPEATLLLCAVLVALGAEPPSYQDHNDLLYYLDDELTQHRIHTVSEWDIRRQHIVANMELVMGPLPVEDNLPVEYHVIEEAKFDGYTRQRIAYQARRDDPVPAYLFIPDKSSHSSAVLALHPTGVLGKGIPAGLSDKPNRNYAQELAQRGYVVLAPDYIYMGDKQLDPYELGYQSGTMKGIYNHLRGVDLLQSLPEVDPERIGTIGHSLGGHNSLFVAVFDLRIKAVVTSCGFNSFNKYKGGDLTGWSSDKYMPRITSVYGKDPARMPFDFTEVLGAIAPRPVFVSAPVDDSNFEVSGVRDCLRTALPVYEKVFDTQDRLVAVHPSCGHDFPADIREQSYQFLDKWLARPTE